MNILSLIHHCSLQTIMAINAWDSRRMKGFMALHKTNFTLTRRFISYQSLPSSLHQCCFILKLVKYVATHMAKKCNKFPTLFHFKLGETCRNGYGEKMR